MKIKGKKLEGPAVEIIVIPRQDGDIVFKASAILDYLNFEKINPMPEPPEIIKPGNIRSYDLEDKEYKEKIEKWALSKTNWMIVTSLKATEDLEWDTVDYSKPETWGNYSNEFKEAGFSPIEVARIIQTVMSACGLNQEKIDEATKRFLAGREAE